jgi:hypothetical protein
MSGELPGTRLACQIMDEIVYPLATAPAAGTGLPRMSLQEATRMGDGDQARVREAMS